MSVNCLPKKNLGLRTQPSALQPRPADRTAPTADRQTTARAPHRTPDPGPRMEIAAFSAGTTASRRHTIAWSYSTPHVMASSRKLPLPPPPITSEHAAEAAEAAEASAAAHRCREACKVQATRCL